MSDASDAFASPVVRKVGGEDVEFPRLTLKDYGVLESAVREHMAAVTRELSDECQMVGQARFEKLREAASMPVTMSHVDALLHTERFARKALELSLARSGKKGRDAEAVIDHLDPWQAGDLARVLVGFLVPFDNTKLVEWHGLAAAIRKHFPGTDPAELTMGQLSHLLAQAKAGEGS
jgi:hypothetical protein